MSPAKLNRFSMVIDNDLGHTHGPGPAVSTVNPLSPTPTYHRIQPYFIRQTSSQMLQVNCACEHPAIGFVAYGPLGGLPASFRWFDKIDVQVGAKKEHGLVKARPLLLVRNPSQKVLAQIKCTFWVGQRWSHQQQRWVEYPGDENQGDTCHVSFDISP